MNYRPRPQLSRIDPTEPGNFSSRDEGKLAREMLESARASKFVAALPPTEKNSGGATPSKIRAEIIAGLPIDWVTPKALSENLGINRDYTGKVLRGLARDGIAERTGNGMYRRAG